MSKLATLCLLFFGVVMLGYSQSAKEIVSRYRTALKKSGDTTITTIKMDGIFTIKKLGLPVSIYYKAPKQMRIEMIFQNMKFIQVSNDSLRWEVNEMTDENSVSRIDKKNGGSDGGSSSFDFVYYDLLNYKEKKHDLKLKGKQKMDSLEVYALELTKSDATLSKVYLNTKNHLIYKIEDKNGYRIFSNYYVNSDYVFPMNMIESSPTQEIDCRFKSMVFGEPIPDSLFAIPQEAIDRMRNEKKSKSRHVSTGDSLYYKKEYQAAILSYDKAIQMDKNDFHAHNGRGLSKLALEDYYEAIADFTKALQINPSAYTARNNMGLAKYYLGDNSGALKEYGKALELKPDYDVTLRNRGQLYLNDKKYDLAAQDFAAAIKVNANDGISHYKYAVSLAQLGKFKEAIPSYNLALKNNCVMAEVYNYKGVSEYRLEKYDTAVMSFRKAVEMEPENLQYIENFGRSLYESRSYVLAAEQFELYLTKKNDNPSIHNLNGLCKYRDENYKGAIKDFSRAIELKGDEATYYDNRASAKEFLEDYDGAIKDYGESIRIYPNDASVFYKRGLVKIATSKKMEGCLDLATANEMKYEPAREAIMKNCN